MTTGIVNQIQFKLATLSEAEQLVAKYVITNKEKVIHMSTQQLAKNAGVSNATIVRFCKSVGVKGFPDLKIMLSADSTPVNTIQQEIKPTDSLDTIKQQLTLRMTNVLAETETLVENEQIESATRLLKNAQEIVVYGLGASQVVAMDFTQKFIRLGKSVVETQDNHLIISALVAKPKDKVVVLISNSGEKKESNTIASLCNELSIPIITIVSNPQSTLAKKSTISLIHSQVESVDTLRSAATASVIAQHYVVDLMYYHYLTDQYDANIEKLNATYQAVRKHLT
ncbi:MAG: MurR/RpiR family transcriptional regulator [Kurthia sp.]|nr:MurR/RpiR family transcriptional regulator [Candidatus Kurthia equi]